MRIFSTLLLALVILAPATPAHAAGAALLTWAPPTAEPVVYDIYGIADGAATHLGSTGQTAFVAPAGYAAYAVRYTLDGQEHEVGVACVAVNLDGEIEVAIDPDCA